MAGGGTILSPPRLDRLHPTCYETSIGFYIPRPGCDANQSILSSTAVWNASKSTATLPVRLHVVFFVTAANLLLYYFTSGLSVRFPVGAGNFSLHHRIQNGSGSHPASHPMGTRGSFPGGKAAGAWS